MKITQTLMKARDKRISVMTELIGAIQVSHARLLLRVQQLTRCAVYQGMRSIQSATLS